MDQLLDAAGRAAYMDHRMAVPLGISGIVLVVLGIISLRTGFRNKAFSWMLILLGVILTGYMAFVLFS